jgi:hypothetical protein
LKNRLSHGKPGFPARATGKQNVSTLRRNQAHARKADFGGAAKTEGGSRAPNNSPEKSQNDLTRNPEHDTHRIV